MSVKYTQISCNFYIYIFRFVSNLIVKSRNSAIKGLNNKYNIKNKYVCILEDGIPLGLPIHMLISNKTRKIWRMSSWPNCKVQI